MRAIRRHSLVLAAVLGGSLVLAACGDDGDDATPTPAADETATDAGTHSDDEMTEEMTEDSGEPATDAAGEAAGGAAAVAALLPGSGTPPAGFDPAAVTGETVAGGTFEAATVEGPVVYWAWAPWCTVCLAESSDIAEAVAATEGEVTFVGVAGLAPQEDMVGFVDQTGLDGIDHLADVDGEQWASLGITGQPSYVIVDENGEAVLWAGALGGELLAEVTAALTA